MIYLLLHRDLAPFERFEKLEKLTVSNNVKVIQIYTFRQCNNLKYIVFKSSPIIWEETFNFMSNKLKKIVFLKVPPKFEKDAFGLGLLSYSIGNVLTIKTKNNFLRSTKLAIAKILDDSVVDKIAYSNKEMELMLDRCKSVKFEII